MCQLFCFQVLRQNRVIIPNINYQILLSKYITQISVVKKPSPAIEKTTKDFCNSILHNSDSNHTLRYLYNNSSGHVSMKLVEDLDDDNFWTKQPNLMTVAVDKIPQTHRLYGSTARSSMNHSQYVMTASFSHGIVALRPNRPAALSIFETSRRLFGSRPVHSRSRKVYNPCIDCVFEYGFQSHMAITSFLNAALDLKDEKEIQNVKKMKRNRDSSLNACHYTVDLRCRTKEGQHFLVELKNDIWNDHHLEALIENSRKLSHLDVNDDKDDFDVDDYDDDDILFDHHFWKDIQGIYTIFITNKVFDVKSMELADKSKITMELLHNNPNELRYTKRLERNVGDIPNTIVLLMLNQLHKSAFELKTTIEDWAYVFQDKALRSGVKHMPVKKQLKCIEMIADRNPGIREFIDRIDVNKLPYSVIDRYLITLNYYNASIADIEEKAYQRGIVIGARKAEKLEIVRELKKLKIPIDQIVKATKLSAAEIEDIKV